MANWRPRVVPFHLKLKKDHISFTYAYNGSKATDKRPAWYTTYQN